MLTLPNSVRFQFIAASGSRGWAGGDEGHGLIRVLKTPCRWLGLFPHIPVVAKTVTRWPCQGNLRLWQPWRAVRLVGHDSLVNCVALTNPGIEGWVRDYYPIVPGRPYPVLASMASNDPAEAGWMADHLTVRCPRLAGIELNLSCPNTGERDGSVEQAKAIFDAVHTHTSLPVIVKLAYQDPYLDICRALDGRAWAFHLINTVPWPLDRPSPLAHYGYTGGVSGRLLLDYARKALLKARLLGLRTPLISGGGVLDRREAKARLSMGAAAVSLGSVYLLRPWRVRRIVND